jgi:hypothetical protein
MTYSIAMGGGNSLYALYEGLPHYSVITPNNYHKHYMDKNMPHYSVITPNNYHKHYMDKNIPHYSVDDKRSKSMYISQLLHTHHLFSFAYQQVYETINGKLAPEYIMIDSGGYSIHTLGLDLTIDDYIKFLKKARYKYAFNFDIIGNPEQTYENQKYIESHGLEVIPVFHLGTPYKHLQRYINEGYNYISLGGMVGKHNKIRIPFLNKCFTLGMKEGTKFHGLGLSHKYCKEYPLYSIDNSNHIMVRRTGEMKIRGRDIKIPRVHGETREERRWNDAEPVLIQLQENIREYKELVKKNWLKYHKYFQGKVTINEVLG